MATARAAQDDNPRSTSEEGKDRSQVQSVVRALMLVDACARAGNAQSAAALATDTGLDRTVVHRLLRTLTDRGLMQKRGSRYSLGAGALRYAAAYLDSHPFRNIALPYAVELQSRVAVDKPWGISLGVPAGDELIVIERLITPAVPLDAMQDIGTRLPMARSAMGRAVLATLEETAQRAVMGDQERTELRDVLAEVRAQDGVAFSRDELRPGISAIAVAVRAPADAVPAGAIAVYGPDLENELKPGARVPATLLRTARRIETALRAAGLL
jgi:DNA-binding IclR family transcriptional regulator